MINTLLTLVGKHTRWGFPKYRKRLRALGYQWNHKRIYRMYLRLKLNMTRKAKRRFPSRHPLPHEALPTSNTCRPIDFMSDVFQHGYRFRTFNVVDDYNREVLGIDISSGITER